MHFISLFTIAIGLSMDAFAVSVCKGLAIKKLTLKNILVIGLWFGGFQALMPLIGYLLGARLQSRIMAVDHWIAFLLLSLIGINMIRESFSKKEEKEDDSLAVKDMFLLAVATSIDALAVGVTFAFLQVSILSAVAFIGITTLVCSAAGAKIGNIFGTRYKSRAERYRKSMALFRKRIDKNYRSAYRLVFNDNCVDR